MNEFVTGIRGRNFSNKWIFISDTGVIQIGKDYAWDGCSPKFEVADLLIGTPDGALVNGKPKTYYASLLHDALYQFKGEHNITRKEADKEFLYQLKKVGFKWAKTYYRAVRLFGWMYGSWKPKYTPTYVAI